MVVGHDGVEEGVWWLLMAEEGGSTRVKKDPNHWLKVAIKNCQNGCKKASRVGHFGRRCDRCAINQPKRTMSRYGQVSSHHFRVCFVKFSKETKH